MILRFFLILIIIAPILACSKNKEKIHEQTLRLNLYSEPPSLDPRKFTDSTSANVLIMLFEGLTRIDVDHKPRPALAEKIDISKDKLTYTFKLRESYWSNGDKVTAEDFASSWEKILDPQFPSFYAYKFYSIKNAQKIKEENFPMEKLGVKVLDERTLEVKLNYPAPYFLELLSFPAFYPVHQKNADANPHWAAESGDSYVSNGPFLLKKWEHESEIVVMKNPDYWDVESVNLESIQLAMVNDTATEFYMYEMGELDWAGSPLSSLPADFLPALVEEGKIEIYPATGTYYYKINTTLPILNNNKIRKALGLSIDRKAIVEHITQAGQQPALALVPSMLGWEGQVCFQDGNLIKARALFQEGLKEMEIDIEDFPTFTLSYNTNREHQKIAQAIQQQWKEGLGIKVILESSDWKVHLSKINKQDFQIGRVGWIGEFNDALSFLDLFRCPDNVNGTGWENPLYTTYLTKAEKETDGDQRKEYLQKAEHILIDAMPIIPIFYIKHAYLKKTYVKDVYVSPLGFSDFKKAYLEK